MWATFVWGWSASDDEAFHGAAADELVSKWADCLRWGELWTSFNFILPPPPPPWFLLPLLAHADHLAVQLQTLLLVDVTQDPGAASAKEQVMKAGGRFWLSNEYHLHGEKRSNQELWWPWFGCLSTGGVSLILKMCKSVQFVVNTQILSKPKSIPLTPE